MAAAANFRYLAGVYLVMTISMALIAAGMSLLVVGWATVYRGRDEKEARETFEEYRRLSWGRGRQRGESVTLFRDGEIDDEYDPRG